MRFSWLFLLPLLLPSCSSFSRQNSIEAEELAALLDGDLAEQSSVQVQVRILAGGEVVQAPTLITRFGEEGTIEITKELIYPSEYDLPDFVEGSGFPVTPATPVAFETRDIGTTLTLEPTREGGLILLKGTLKVVEFRGFVESLGEAYELVVNSEGNLLTENKVQMPMFETYETPIHLATTPGRSFSVKEIAYPRDDARLELRIDLLPVSPGTVHLIR